MMKAAFICFWLLSLHGSHLTSASHFRGGQLTWKPDPINPRKALFHMRLSWRLDWTSTQLCDNQTIVSHTLVGPADDIECFTGCGSSPLAIGDTQVYCTEFSVADNWMIGEREFSHTFPKAGVYEVGYRSGMWISVSPKQISSSWSVVTTVDLRVRNDTGRVNSPPTMVGQPIVRINNRCKNVTKIISIPMADDDNDRTHCRWATGTDECEQVCNGLPMATLQQFPCQLSVPADQVTSNWYVVALMMEDFAPNSNTTLSKVPLQFLVEGFKGPASCAEPKFVSPTPPDGSVFHFDSNCPGPFQINVTARPGTPTDSIDEISVIGGVAKGSVTTLNNVYGDSYSILSWSPPKKDRDELISYTAKDITGASTLPSSITVKVYKDSSSVPSACVNIPNCQYCGSPTTTATPTPTTTIPATSTPTTTIPATLTPTPTIPAAYAPTTTTTILATYAPTATIPATYTPTTTTQSATNPISINTTIPATTVPQTMVTAQTITNTTVTAVTATQPVAAPQNATSLIVAAFPASSPETEWRYYFILGSTLFLISCTVIAIVAYRRRRRQEPDWDPLY